MKLILAVFLNLALLSVLLPWLWRQWQQVRGIVRVALAVGLGLRLLVAVVVGRHLVHDALHMSLYSWPLTAQIWADPGAALGSFWGDELHFGGLDLVYHGMSNTFFFVKIVAILNLASLNTHWLNAIYFSIFSFVGCWKLAQAVGKALPETPVGAGLLGFVVWPSVIFWASGVTKESVVLGSSAWLMAVFIELFYGKSSPKITQRLLQVLGLIILTIIHFKIRYFFAMPLLGALLALAIILGLQRAGLARSRVVQVVVLAAVLGGGAWLAADISVAFRVNKFTNQVVTIYQKDRNLSVGNPHFEYPDLQPNIENIVRHMPLAAVNALTRPWLGESKDPRYVAAALENALLLVLLAVALLAAWRKKSGRFPFGLAMVLVVHCVALAILLGLSTPNLGALHRYRSGLLPYLVLLLLQNDYAATALQRLGFRRENAWPPQ